MQQVSLLPQQMSWPVTGSPRAQIVAIAMMDSGTYGAGRVMMVGVDVTSNGGLPVGSTFQVPSSTKKLQ
jgi:hypothetical protein